METRPCIFIHCDGRYQRGVVARLDEPADAVPSPRKISPRHQESPPWSHQRAGRVRHRLAVLQRLPTARPVAAAASPLGHGRLRPPGIRAQRGVRVQV